jgi:uncharacterized protein DUF3313
MMRTLKQGMCVCGTLLGVSLLLSIGCSSTFQTRDVTTSGFLGDYSQLKEGSGDEAHLLYIDPQTDFAAYNKILMDPVKIYSNVNSKLEELSKEDKQRIVDYLRATIFEKLKSDYTFVKEQGAGVMRLRVSITEAEGSQVILDTVSSIIPIGMALGLIKKVATGTNLSVGEAGVEMELQDSQTGKRLAAAVDKRAGRKYTGKFDKFDKYHTVEDAFDHWAERLQKRLADLRQKQLINN